MGRAWVPEAKEVQDATICGKVMTTVILDAKGVIILDILPKRSTITRVYYANLLDLLRTVIREKRRGKLSKGVLLQQDNARVHTCKVAMDAVERNEYPAYSPDLAPSDFFLFSNLKKDIRGLHFRSVKKWRQLRGESMERTLTFSVLAWWHLNTVGLSASH